MIIKAKIDVKKIEKARLYVGEKCTYLDCTLLENKDGTNSYGDDFMIVQDVSKAERESGVKGPIIGNARFAKGSKPTAEQAPAKKIEDDDVPF